MKKRDRIKAKYGSRCAYSGSILEPDWQIDHGKSKAQHRWDKVPENPDDEANLVPACRICNHYKRGKGIEGFRKYMLKFHIRLGKLPKNTSVERTKKRIEYMWCIANKYGITPDKPFNGIFWMDQYKTEQ